MPQLTLKGHKIYYSESRDALAAGRPPLLLIHGAGGEHAHWPPHLRRLSNTTVYALDLAGHAKSEGPSRRTVAAYVDDVLAFMDALNLRRAIVGGHSMGGAIAQTLALNYPDRVAGLLLVGTGARLRVREDILDGLVNDFERAVDLIVELSYGPNTSDQTLRVGRRVLRRCTPQVIHGDYVACNRFDVRARLGEIRVPTLVLTGTADQMTPEKYARYLAEHIPSAELALVQGMGHMVAVEAPDEVAAIVDSWLSRLAKRR